MICIECLECHDRFRITNGIADMSATNQITVVGVVVFSDDAKKCARSCGLSFGASSNPTCPLGFICFSSCRYSLPGVLINQ